MALASLLAPAGCTALAGLDGLTFGGECRADCGTSADAGIGAAEASPAEASSPPTDARAGGEVRAPEDGGSDATDSAVVLPGDAGKTSILRIRCGASQSTPE